MKRSILFVDDEPMVLAGLQRMLRPMRGEWEMAFANSGAEALTAMDKLAFDLIVSDMRMPGMNGAQLLKEVARRHPQVARFILSGQADPDLTLECIGTAHQFLSKPCEPDTLKTAVTRTFAVDALLTCPALRAIVSQLTTVPSLPSLYNQIMKQLASPEASIETIGETIARDPGMTAKVLQFVNSAFFGSRRRMSNPTEAALLLGLETIKTLVLWIHVFSDYSARPLAGFSIEVLSTHCLATGLLARSIARAEGGESRVQEEAMTAGLLHDIGRLVLATNRPDLHQQVAAAAAGQSIPWWEAELSVLGTTHAQMGAYLLGLWGLPFDIVEAVAMHHCPQTCGNSHFSPLTAVHVANALLHQREDPPGGASLPLPDLVYLDALGLAGRLEHWQTLVCDTPAKVA